MDSACLLVIDVSPESAEEVNSLLRNSGIAAQVGFADCLQDAEHHLKISKPQLTIYNDSAHAAVNPLELLQLCQRHSTQVVVRAGPDSNELLSTALEADAFIAVNRNQDHQLAAIVEKHITAKTAQRELANAENRMEELQQRYNLLLDSARDPIAYIHEGLHVYANKAYLESMEAETLDEISAYSLLELMKGHELDLKKLFREMNNGRLPEKAISVTVTNPTGTVTHCDLMFSKARFEGENCIQMMVRKKDAQAVINEELDRLRQYDPLTQTVNRAAFMDRLTSHLENFDEKEDCSAVYFLQPDGLDSLQSQLGVAGMDRLIAELATCIKGSLTENDLAAHFTDYTFTILARRQDKQSLHQLGEKMVDTIGQHVIELDNRSMTISCSIGMANIGQLTSHADEAVANARSAFAEAQESGNCLARFKPQLVSVTPEDPDRQWVDRLRYALDNQEFYSIQQSIVNLDGDLEGLFEDRTFLRDESGDARPDDFLPIAERNDLGVAIDRCVIPSLLKAIANSQDTHIINISANSMLDVSFPGWFEKQLEELNVSGKQVVLQISSQAAESNIRNARTLFEELRGTGCAFSLANFDDARTTCQLIEMLKPAFVKLRPGLAKGMNQHPDHLEVIRKVVHEAESAGVAVIAGEVQDASDLAVLWQCGVKLVAGDFLKEAPQVVGQ